MAVVCTEAGDDPPGEAVEGRHLQPRPQLSDDVRRTVDDLGDGGTREGKKQHPGRSGQSGALPAAGCFLPQPQQFLVRCLQAGAGGGDRGRGLARAGAAADHQHRRSALDHRALVLVCLIGHQAPAGRDTAGTSISCCPL